MDQGKQRGRSRKKKQNRFLTSLLRGNHRRLSALLCATMVLNGTASAFPVMAAEKEPETIALTSSDLWDALDAAIEDGTVEAPDFGDSYAELFGDDVYRLSVSPVIADDDLNVDVYANVASESLDAEEEYSKDSVDFVFLVSNGNKSDEKKVQIAIDGKKSVEVTVPASSDTETDVLLEDPAESKAESPTEPEAESPTEPESKPATEEESSAEESKPEESQPTDAGEDENGTGETKPEEPSAEAPADPSEPDGTDDEETGAPGTDDETPGEDSQKPEETPGTGETAGENSGETETGDNGGDETVSDGSDEEKPEDSETETGETPEEDSQQPGGEDLDNSSESAEETGGQTSADDLEVTEGDAPEADNSDSGSSEGTGDESDSSESAIAALSVSLHDAPYLAVGGTNPLASGSVIEEDENGLAGQWIEDAALLSGKAVVAYVISGGELNDEGGLVVDEETKTASIYTAAGLREWAETVTEDNGCYDGYIIEIMNDIDLGGENWTSIISLGGTVTIDGNGHTISNMTIEEQKNGKDGNTYLGFIGNLNYNTRLTVQNITFENAHVQDLDGDSEYSWCGVVVGHGPMEGGLIDGQADCTFENVNIVNSVVTGGHNNGGILGYSGSSQVGHLFKNCSVNNSFIGGYNSTSGILFGMGISKVFVENCETDGTILYTDGLNFNCSQSKDEQLWVGNVYPHELYPDNPERVGELYVADSNSMENTYAVYPVHFHIGNQIIKKYVPVNTDLSQFDSEWFGNVFEVGSGKHIVWKDGTTANANVVTEIVAELGGADMYPYDKTSLVNDEPYTTQDTDQVENPLTHGAIELYASNAPADPINPDAPEWETSKSKKATNLDSNYESRVTLSLPAAQETLETDVVFVVDKSTSVDVQDEAVNMLKSLQKQVEDSGAVVNVGVVIFNKEAHRYDWGNLTNENDFNRIESALRNEDEIKSGTNVHAGLLEGKRMLDEDTDVDANRKYLILVSDGITYLFDEPAQAINSQQPWNGEYGVMAGNDCWSIRHYLEGGVSYLPDDWNAYLNDVGNHLDEVAPYIQTYAEMDQENHIPRGDTKLPTTVDVALYKSAQVYAEMETAGYHCYALKADTGAAADNPWGVKFMDYLANGKKVSFAEIQHDIYYLLDAGSTVVDEIGYGDDYDFAFVKPEDMELTVNKVLQEMILIEENHWGFGQQMEDGKYPYEVTYYPEGTDAVPDEHFVWTINVPVTNFAPVQLTYTVKLTNPHTESGTYGTYDEDGSEGYTGLYTNKEATLNPVDSYGYKGEPETFPKPTVSYTVDKGGETPDPKPDPDEEQFTITVNYYRKSDNAVLRDAQVITLDANAAYNVRDLVNAAISGYRWDSYSVPEGQTGDLTGTLTGDLVFNVYYVASSTSPGGSGGSSGGGGGSRNPYNPGGGPGVTIEEDAVPLAPLPENNEAVAINEDNVPLSPLPKTGQERSAATWLAMLSGLVTAAYVLFNRKREQN